MYRVLCGNGVIKLLCAFVLLVKQIKMRIGVVLYWCVLAFHLCKADETERTESRENGRRPQWGPGSRSGSFVTDPAVSASNDQSKFNNRSDNFTASDTCSCPSMALLIHLLRELIYSSWYYIPIVFLSVGKGYTRDLKHICSPYLLLFIGIIMFLFHKIHAFL